MMAEDQMAEKKLRGSGGYAIARVTDPEQKKANLGGPELFLAGIGRLDQDRFVKYYCSKCEKEFEGSPQIVYDNPNEELGEGVTLVEKGEYKCKTCNATIAQYRRFETPPEERQENLPRSETAPPQMPAAVTHSAPANEYLEIQSVIGMSAYDSEAMLIGRIEEIGLRRSGGNARITLKVAGKEISWDNVSKIGDIILVGSSQAKTSAGGKCVSCGYQNEADSAFCAECGNKI
jgi:sporulation protein YlmC with PRC-barrel domain/DNA-directed RNA polymerase subunit RPC12/RpoP